MWAFPILDDKELLTCISELGYQLTIEQLRKPTVDNIKPFYEHAVLTLMAVTREELQQPVFYAIDALEFPELHDESIGCLAFNRALTKLMAGAGVHDFTLKDLYKPEYKRTSRNLSAIINFAKYREEKVMLYDELNTKQDALLHKKHQLEEANLQLTHELKRMEAERAADIPAVEALQQETEGLGVTINELNKQQALLASQNKALKQAGSELADEIKEDKFRLINAQQERAMLRSKVVESPEKLQRCLEELSVNVESKRAAISEAERRSRDLQSKLECCSKVEKEVQKCVRMMEEAEQEIAKYKSVSKEVKAANSKIAANEDEARRLEVAQQYLKRQGQSMAERLKKLEQQHVLKKANAAQALEEARALKHAAEAENQASNCKLSHTQEQIRAVQKKMAETRAAHDRETGLIRTKYAALCNQVRKYHQSLAAAMGEPPRPTASPLLG